MNGERAATNGYLTNGITKSPSKGSTPSSLPQKHITPRPQQPDADLDSNRRSNGSLVTPEEYSRHTETLSNEDQASSDILQLVSRDAYLPMARLISSVADDCWSQLVTLVEDLAPLTVPPLAPEPAGNGAPYSTSQTRNPQTKASLEKKERWLNFAQYQKGNFIKLMVLLQASKDAEQLARTIDINFWLNQQRYAFARATQSLATIMRDSIGFQTPNPDLKTAGEVLSTGRATQFSNLGYQPTKVYSHSRILSTLRKVNNLLEEKMTLHTDIPPVLQRFKIHDGRITFSIPNRFELDLSVLDEAASAPFRFLDFRLLFSSDLTIPNTLHEEISQIANLQIDESGLIGCYEFFNQLTLSYLLNEFHRQATEMVTGQWLGHIKVEFLRRTMIVQYWANRTGSKSWIEIGVRSGRESSSQSVDEPAEPTISLRWFREGKLVTDHNIHIDLRSPSFESVLRQILARHSSYVLDYLYDRLESSPVFASGNLLLEQRTSDDDPDDCSVAMEVLKHTLTTRIDTVSGNFVISPAGKVLERAQFDINRSKNVLEDMPKILLNARCGLANESISRLISSTSWEHLKAFKPSQSELKALFGTTVVYCSFYRQSCWTREYIFAITHSIGGDRWSILRQELSDDAAGHLSIVHMQVLVAGKSLSVLDFEKLTDDSSGIIVLKSNADKLKSINIRHLMPPLVVTDASRVPDLVCDFDSILAMRKRDNKAQIISKESPKRFNGRTISISYSPTKRTVSKVVVTARSRFKTNRAVLERLQDAGFDKSLTIDINTGNCKVRALCSVGTPVVENLIQRFVHLEDLILCVKNAQQRPGISIGSLSANSMNIMYQKLDSVDLHLNITFRSGKRATSLDFSPATSNPHRYLTGPLSSALDLDHRPMPVIFDQLLSMLSLTLPILSWLQKLQPAPEEEALRSDRKMSLQVHEKLRAHVLVRNPCLYALQYYSTIPLADPKNVGTETPDNLVARFEILPHTYGKHTMWLVRPAIEEFETYTRPSFASQELKDTVRNKVWRPSPQDESNPVHHKWLNLDSGAACLTSEPAPLLNRLQEVLVEWIDEKSKSRGVNAETAASIRTEPLTTAGPTNVVKNTQDPKKPLTAAGAAAAAAERKPMNNNAGSGSNKLAPQKTQATQPQAQQQQQQNRGSGQQQFAKGLNNMNKGNLMQQQNMNMNMVNRNQQHMQNQQRPSQAQQQQMAAKRKEVIMID